MFSFVYVHNYHRKICGKNTYFTPQNNLKLLKSSNSLLLGGCFVTWELNGLQLGEVAEIEGQMFSFVQKFNRRTAVDFCTEPAILPNCCYVPYFFM